MGLNISVGQPVNIERRLGNNRVKGSSRILGAKPPRFLMIEMPMAATGPVITTTNQKCIVRFLRAGTLVGFWAHVLKIIAEPFPMVIVEYTPDVEEVTIRQAERVDCNIPATITMQMPKEMPQAADKKDDLADLDDDGLPRRIAKPEQPLKAFIVDLSKGGCQLAVPLNFWKHTVRKILSAKDPQMALFDVNETHDQMIRGNGLNMAFELPVPAQKGSRQVDGEVRWMRREGANVFVGVQFKNATNELAQDILRVIEHQREYFTRRFEVL